VFRIRPDALFPDGTPVEAADILAAWEPGPADEALAHRWLLVRTGPSTGGRLLELCTARGTPDLSERLAHPDLWISRESPGTGYREGPGPFVETAANVLEPNPFYSGLRARVDRIEWVPLDGRDAALLFGFDGADAALLYGGAAPEMGEPGKGDLQVKRVPALDRTYFLWMHPTSRWVNDPRVRRWIAGKIDREETIRYLFRGAGAPAFRLLGNDDEGPAWDAVEQRPLSETTIPRIELLHDGADREARRLSLRIAAMLEPDGLAVDVQPRPSGEIRAGLREGSLQMALLAHRPSSDDPLLALRQTLEGIRGAETAMRILDRGVERRSAAERLRSAEYAEESLLIDGRLVPLVRLQAWLVTRRGLTIPLTGNGRPMLDQARWLED
jgi:MarR-like DNA-binding transcriptional regulator SgrR of sgrS sRNA